ncbi:hypothetical protein AXE76_04200 [Gardnerella vaginalis]|uniref:Uncharacterized protein n=1 Tax=Gardnerella vaginalis TaxID=2702 RepID=A0A3E1IRL5_GARVA|nr:hypothetical protein [Gardnerella vaginalis]MBF9308457.1 hypothetical protein [Bifidobacteriaceae bacterium NR043]MBF9353838.1 hypothetical protein [Bifidobacteriaceae bacterium NR044]RFD75374.1 hypothetical protein AXE76_04200 [Gardnerella vaginalis]RIY16703.1 hypothetical protein CJI57_05590 [Bifidobacteriaceae bacterium WP012]
MKLHIGLFHSNRDNKRWYIVLRCVAVYIIVWLCVFNMLNGAKESYYQQYYDLDYALDIDGSITESLEIAHKKSPGHEPNIQESAPLSCNDCQDKLSDEGVPLITTMLFDYFKFKNATSNITKAKYELFNHALSISDMYVTHNYEYD